MAVAVWESARYRVIWKYLLLEVPLGHHVPTASRRKASVLYTTHYIHEYQNYRTSGIRHNHQSRDWRVHLLNFMHAVTVL